jgi:hypothetical protein
MNSRRPFLVAALAASAAIPLGCGGKTPPANASFSFGGDGGTPSTQPCAPGQPCPPPPSNCAPGQPCPPPANTTPNTTPTANNPPPTGTCPPGVVFNPLDPNTFACAQAGLDPVELGIRAAAMRYAPGMTPEGQVAKGSVAEGGHVQFITSMDASHCYTVVGFGFGVTELDVTLLAPPLYNLAAGQDTMAGPTAVLAPSPQPLCPQIPLPIPYKVDVVARKGGGMIGAQVYSKPK